jgi:DGQHR domain-containing protein
MKPAAMQRLFFVSSYEKSDPDSPAPRGHGYQREPMKERIPRIAEYFLRDEHEFLITPLIVSVRLEDLRDIEEFVRLFNDGDAGAIHRHWHKATVSIVDGQHRFLGLVEAHRRNPEFDPWVPVMLYFDLEYMSEAELFDTINTTARKLPKALIEVTKGDITDTGSDTWAQQVRTVTFGLARDDDSVWYGKVNMTGARDPDRKVTYEGLRRSTANMLPAELMARLSKVGLDPEEVAKRYWALVADACKPAWDEVMPPEYEAFDDEVDPETGESTPKVKFPGYRLGELVGVASVARLGRDILTSALEHKDFDHRMGELVEKLSEVDWLKSPTNPWMRSQGGVAGQKELYGVLHHPV